MPTEERNAKSRLKIVGFNFEHDYPITMILFDQNKLPRGKPRGIAREVLADGSHEVVHIPYLDS